MLPPASLPPIGRLRRARPGFTLIELLTVVAIMTVLAGISFSLMQGMKERAAIGQTRAELAVLAQVLGQYQRENGDFPQTADTPEELYQALTGKRGPAGNPINGRNLLRTISLARSDPEHPDDTNQLVDPWGNAYQYIYFTQQAGTAPPRRGYVLFSYGARTATEPRPTRGQVVPATSGAEGGAISESALNAKNLYTSP